MKRLLKILRKIMNYGIDIDHLMSLKNSFQGNTFQWIKTQDQTRLGKVVTVVEIEPGPRGKFVATLSDGARIDTDQLTNNLLMLHDDQPQMSIAEIRSINYIPSIKEAADNPDLPAEVRESFLQAPQPEPAQQAVAPVKKSVPVEPTDIFGMFALEDTELPINVSIKLPARPLLKMMYSNSQDKDKFIDQLSTYINNSVTPESVKESLTKLLTGPDKKKKS